MLPTVTNKSAKVAKQERDRVIRRTIQKWHIYTEFGCIYATSVWLSLSHDPFLVLLLLADLLATVGSTAF